ncbi:hypothetical protein LSH36_5g18059 [Paralvinella palmiformis]|uniref:Uncharacterized protein n=1 Tax=Paralvinella palmiformis TaxID=53620 RepID=A0AAD9KFW7_9ANNE|nr:hypothetical protein LSH36_5g18059 [Paralvinella palmiformis]
MGFHWLLTVIIVRLIHSQVRAKSEDYCISTWNTYGAVAIDVDYQMSFDVMRSMKVYFCDRKDILIQLWLPTDKRDEMQLIWEYPITAPDTVPSEKMVIIPKSAQIQVLPTYRMGVAPTVPGLFPMGMNFFPSNQGSVIVSKLNYYPDSFDIGDKVPYIDLMYPYKFSIGVCNDTAKCELPDISQPTRPLLNETTNTTTLPPFLLPGPPGPMGIPGPMGQMGQIGVVGISGDMGSPGEEGYKGLLGDEGPSGLPGPAGKKGPVGDPGPAVDPGKRGSALTSVEEDCDCTGFRDPNVVLGMLIWALLLTLLIVVGLLIVTRSMNEVDKTR